MNRILIPILIIALALSTSLTSPTARAETTIKSICRVKGQEENTLQGLGIVVGLKGTGDGASFLPTIRSLSKIMTVMGEPLGKAGMAELKDTKNVALVTVTATIPAAGARQGDQLDCSISSIGSAKSLAGGRLFLTALVGPDRNNPRIYAFSEGAISLDDTALPTTGKVFKGCRLESDFFNMFSKDGKITLVLDRNHADFQVAQDVADQINNQLSFQTGGATVAKALNQVNVEVVIPAQYKDDPVPFISQVINLPMPEMQTGARVVINERSGSIVMSGNVEIGAVVVTHKNIVIETGNPVASGNSFVQLDPGNTSKAKLKALVEALNAIHVATPDIIDIIKGLDRNGKLHAQLIIE
jgi:flagellar P-ring protein FlgI